MHITWFGQACFKIQTTIKDQEVTIITDPYSKELGLKLPRILSADIVTVSHQHYDHNNVDLIGKSKQEPFIINHVGEYEVKSVYIQGISTYHDKSKGAERGMNTVYKMYLEHNIVLAHLGDIGHVLTTEQLDELNGVHILLIPVGGVYTIDSADAQKIISEIEPKIVIPMHYDLPGLKVDLDPVEKFLHALGIKEHEPQTKLKISKKDLEKEGTQTIVLTPSS